MAEITECPACGDEFDTIAGMRKHYGISKDEIHEGIISKETIECRGCETEVTDYKERERKYCQECVDNVVWIDEEVKQKMSEAKKGENHWAYGLTGEDHPAHGNVLSEETKQQISESNAGVPKTEEHRKNISKGISGENHGMYGETHTEEAKKKISESQIGEKCYRWKGGTRVGYSRLFYENRSKALERDGYECRVCGDESLEGERDLHVHHIKPRSEFMEDDMNRPPDEAAELSNLFTVCQVCHPTVEVGNIEIPDNGNNEVN